MNNIVQLSSEIQKYPISSILVSSIKSNHCKHLIPILNSNSKRMMKCTGI